MSDIIKELIAKFIKDGTKEFIPISLRDQFIESHYYYPYQNEKIRRKLSGEKGANKVNFFIKKIDPEYWEAYKKFENILGNGLFNPYKDYALKNYFIKSKSYDELDMIYDFKKLPDIEETIAYKGEKGSGKTALINCWLHENNKKLEENRILWVLCNGHTLYRLWLDCLKFFSDTISEELKILTIKEYLSIEFLYIFCKYTLDSNSEVVNDIISLLLDKKPRYQHQTGRRDIYTTQPRLIYDGIIDIKNKIATMEKDKKESYNYAINVVMKISALSTHQKFKNQWMSLSDKLADFLTDNGFWILNIVDGVDNVHINDQSAEPYYKKMLVEAFDFLKRKPKKRHIHLMVMRERTYIECISMPPMPDTVGYIEDVNMIEHAVPNFTEVSISQFSKIPFKNPAIKQSPAPDVSITSTL